MALYGSIDSQIGLAGTTKPTTKPTLVLDFANSKKVDNRITFTRSTSATYFDANGILQTAPANQPRIDYDPVTKECRGLLIEDTRTNYMKNFTTWGTEGKTALYKNSVIGPDGLFSGSRVSSFGDNWRISTAGIAITTGSTYATISVWVKQGNRPQSRFEYNFNDGTNYIAGDIYYTYATNQLTHSYNGTYTPTNPFIPAIAGKSGDWTRISLAVPIQSTFNTVVLYAYGGEYWGVTGYTDWAFPQVELGLFATTYIPYNTTFTSRNSAATYIDSTGTVRTAGINQPRYGYNYDSASGTWKSQGLVIENAVTNIALYSSTAKWGVDTGTTVTANSAVAPDGNTTADLVTTTTASTTIYHDMTAVSGTSGLTFSIYLKAGTATSVNLQLWWLWNSYQSASMTFNFSSGTITSPGGLTSLYGVQTLSNGWYRVWVTGVGTDAANNSSRIQIQNPSANTTYYTWGAQVENAYTPSSVVLTNGAAATRAADVTAGAAATRGKESASITGTNFSSFYTANEGTIYFEGNLIGPRDINYYPRFVAFVGTDIHNSTMGVSATSPPNTLTGSTIGGSVTNLLVSPTGETAANVGLTAGVNRKMAMAYSTNNLGFTADGQSSTDQSISHKYPIVNRMLIYGITRYQDPVGGYCKKIAFYPKRLTNAELQALTQ